MANSKTDKTTKVMDVTVPGKTAPTPSAKPIIVSNRPMLRHDPMMATSDGLEREKSETMPVSRVAKTITVGSIESPASSADKPATEEKITVAVMKPTVPPIAGGQPALGEPVPASAGAAAAPVPEQVPGPEVTAADVPAPADQEKVPSPAPVEPKPAAAPTAATAQDSVPDGSSPDKGDAQLAPNQEIDEAKRQQDEATTSRHLEEEKIIASKQYYLPIASRDRRRGLQRAVLILVGVIILGIVWLDIVLDAGIVHIAGVHALTHFFTSS